MSVIKNECIKTERMVLKNCSEYGMAREEGSECGLAQKKISERRLA